MSDFEKWFKTTSAYRMLESMNYYKMDLFHWIEARGEYRHTSVQIAFMTWVEQQAKIDELQKRIDEYKKLTTSIRNEFDLWSDDSEFAGVVEAQIENLEALRGDND